MDSYDIQPAFFVEGELDPSVGLPMDGLTYLKIVRHEANRLADINVSDIDPRVYDSLQTRYINIDENKCISAPSGFGPKSSWVQQFVREFTALRNKYLIYKEREYIATNTLVESREMSPRLPGLKDRNGWYHFFFGSPDKPCMPTLGTVSRFDEVSVIRLLKYHIYWFRESESKSNHVPWLFALLVALETPVDANMQAELHSLMVKCCEERVKLISPEDPLLPKLNILITIVSMVFGQAENYD